MSETFADNMSQSPELVYSNDEVSGQLVGEDPSKPNPPSMELDRDEPVHTPVTAIISSNAASNNYLCNQCGSSFRRKFCWERHMRKHTGDVLHCEQCPRTFSDKHHLDQHTLSKHHQVRLSCDLCAKEYTTKSTLARHVAQEHSDSHKHTCDMCGKGFALTQKFMEHVNIHHKIKPHACNRCPAAFSAERALKFHLKICGTEESIECPRCSKKFKHSKYLAAHMATHESTEKCHQCVQCGIRFSRKWSLLKHEKQKHQ